MFWVILWRHTTQNHIDSALTKRVPGDIIDARQVEITIPAALIIAIVIDFAVIFDWITDNDKVRGNDVEILVEHFDRLLPET